MSATNIVTASFGTSRSVSTRRLYQYDYGQILQIEGVDLPSTYTVHFANKPNSGDAIIQIGDDNGVGIPDSLLETGEYVYAWVFLHVGENDGETMYMATIPVNRRARPTSDTPTPAQQDVIDTAIAALTSAKAAIDELAITPQEFGAKGDGETDDAHAIKDCIDYALEHKCNVFIPAGTYIVSPQVITINFVGNDSLTIFGCGKSTCIKRKDNSLNNKWDRLFVVNNSGATANSGSFIIRDLYIDSNRRNQANATMDYTYEAAADIMSYFSSATYSIDTVLFENLWFYDGVADHIDFTGSGVVNAENIIINNVFASGRVATRNDIDFPGIPKKNVYITNVDVQRIHNEYNGTPTAPQYYFYNNVKCKELTIGGKYANVMATNVRVAERLTCGGYDANYRFSNCEFNFTGEENHYLIATNGRSKFTFSDCTFNSYDRTTAGGTGVDNYATYLYIRPGYDIVFDNCRFEYKGENESVAGYPICWLYNSDLNNKTVLRGCHIDPKFSWAFVFYSPGTVLIENMVIENPNAFYVRGNNGKGNVTLRNVELKDTVTSTFYFSTFSESSFAINGEVVCNDNYLHIGSMSSQSCDETRFAWNIARKAKITSPLTKSLAQTVFGTSGSYTHLRKGDTLIYAGSNPELYPEKWVSTVSGGVGSGALNSSCFISYGSGYGTTANRPECFLSPGFQYYDTDLGKTISWDGSAWKNLDGTALNGINV